MILYGAPNPAPNPRRVRIFLAEKGIELPETPLNLAARDHKSEAHLSRNSLGQVPTLVLDDGTAISETVAICRYFEAVRPDPALFGSTPVEQALIEQQIRRIEFQVMSPVGAYWRHAHPYTAKLIEQHKAFGESNKAIYQRALGWLDRELEGQDFIAPSGYSMADICALTTVDFATWIGLERPAELANVAAWHARVTARPSASA